MDTTKKCTKCDNVKPLAEFYKNKSRKDGHRPQCKGCAKRHYKENKVAIAVERKRYYEKNRGGIIEQKKRHYEKNKGAKAEYNKRYYEKNKGAIIEQNKRYNEENRGAIIEQKKRYEKERRATDPLYRLTRNIRTLIGMSFTRGCFSKKSKTAAILGCSFEEFHRHIENHFVGDMSWERMSEIHIDHRLPVSAATTEAEILVLNHHSNLQPMWATDNLAKSDSYCPKELAAYFKKHLPT